MGSRGRGAQTAMVLSRGCCAVLIQDDIMECTASWLV
jgi:hypothetical protein